jgi:tripartite-type tricarboxylate transporter receptor subunit TctC
MLKRLGSVLVFFLMVTGYAVCGGTQDTGSKSNASQWPTGTVTVYHAEAGGGLTDATSRVLGGYIQEKTGQPITYINTIAGNGTVAFESVRTAKPDGNTLLYFHMGLFTQYSAGLYEYNPLKDFDLIAAIPAVAPYVMVVRSDFRLKTAADIAKYIKENPNTLTCGVQLGATAHVMAGEFALDAGGAFKYVESGSTTLKINNLIGGHIDVSVIAASSVKQYVDNGDMIVIGIYTGDGKPDPLFPGWPAFGEMGFSRSTWSVDYQLFGPKGMDPALKQEIYAQYAAAVQSNEVKAALAKMNQPVAIESSMDASYKYISTKAEVIKQVLKSLGLLKNE